MRESRSAAPWPRSSSPRHSPPPRLACQAPLATSPGPRQRRTPRPRSASACQLSLLVTSVQHLQPLTCSFRLPPPGPQGTFSSSGCDQLGPVGDSRGQGANWGSQPPTQVPQEPLSTPPPSSTPSTPPQTTWPPSASQARWPLADHWSCLPPSPGEAFCFTQGAVPTYTFLSKSICGPPQISSVQGMMQVPGHSLPRGPGILVTKTRLSLSKWHVWQARVARFSTVCPVVCSSVFHQHDTVRNTPALE